MNNLILTKSVCISGTPALTSRGFVEEDFVKVAEYFDAAVKLAVNIKAETTGFLQASIPSYFALLPCACYSTYVASMIFFFFKVPVFNTFVNIVMGIRSSEGKS